MLRRLILASMVVLCFSVADGLSAAESKLPAKAKDTTAVAKPRTKKKTAKPDTTKPKEIKLPKLVDLGANKCIPCKMMAPILDQLGKDLKGKLEVVVLDVWQNPDEGNKYKIRVIPTQIFYSPEGKELFRHEGFYSREDILKKWRELGYDLEKEAK